MRKFPISARHVACMYIGSADSFNYPAIYILLFCTSLTEKRREKCRVWGFHSEKPD